MFVGISPDDGKPLATYTFAPAADVLDKLPARYEKVFGERDIYMAGWMSIRQQRYPFLITTGSGNGLLVYFRDADGQAYSDAELRHIILVPGQEREKDLLFIGGDFVVEPFSAYVRGGAAAPVVQPQTPRPPQTLPRPQTQPTQPKVPAGVWEALDEGIKMLEAKRCRQFVERFVHPLERERVFGTEGIDKLVERFERDDAPKVLALLKAARAVTPVVLNEGKTVRFNRIKANNNVEDIAFTLHEGVWYIRD